MRCYRCNSVLSDSDYCLKCGADVSIYKVVVRASNSHYNAGLEKARVRDLTGAIGELKTSLQLNRNNIKARNLLGLVYYEVGEVAMALSEWKICLELKKERNVAEVYIKKVRANPNKLELANQSIKKYNFSLAKARQGGDDVAIIQLKRVVAGTPNYVKASLLLALLYMKKGNDDHAAKLLGKVLKIDRNNTTALRYLNEMNRSVEVSARGGNVKGSDRRGYRKELSGNDVILPKNSYKEPSSGVLTVVYILLGIIIGVALVWFLVVPAKLQSAQHASNEEIKKYSEQLSSYSVDITRLENMNKELSDNLQAAESDLASHVIDANLYESLVKAVLAYMDNDFDEMVKILGTIDVTKLPTDSAKSLYTSLEESSNGGSRMYYLAGVNAYNQNNYVDAIKYLEKAYEADKSFVEISYYLAKSYMGINDKAGAQQYVLDVITRFPDSQYVEEMQALVIPTE